MQRRILTTIAVVLLASTAPAALAAEQQSSGYTGTNVAFETTSNALLDYSVGGTTVAESIRVQSQAETESSLSLGGSADLGAVVDISGAGLSVDARAESSATVESESGATLTAHDDGHGSLVVEADGEAQYVEFGLEAAANATAQAEDRVVVTTGDGTTATVLVVGDGAATVNEDGNVSAELGGDARLVFRSYTEGRTEADEQVESLIADGTAAASVSLDGDANAVVDYDDNTSVTITEETQGRVAMTVNRTEHDGKVIVTSVANDTFTAVEDVQVSVDGEAAVRAASYSELKGATNGGDTSKFMVAHRTSGSADVLVGVNHFSTRDVTVSDGDDTESGESTDDTATATDGEGDATTAESTDGRDEAADGTTTGDGPGVGALGAILAIGASIAVLARRGR